MAAAAFERLHELEGVMDVLLDERVGLIRALRQRPREAGDANIFEFVARACDTSAFSRLKNFGDTGGASVDPSRAVAKAIGEGIERYCSAIFEPTDFTVATYAEAPFNCVAPQDFALYGASQYAQPDFPFEPFTDTTPVRWVGGLDPLKLEICHVPAAMVFVPYFFYLGSGEVPISQPISTGLACHFGSTAAAASAVCEVIERDAFMITWQAQMSRAKIRRDSLSEANLDLIARLEIRGGRVEVLDMTMDVGVTTVLSVLRGASKSAAVIVAGSADARPENAVRKSLEELEHTRRYSQSLYEDMARDSPGSSEAESDFAHIVDQSSHLSFWTQPRHSQFAEFLFASEERIHFDDLPDNGAPERRDELESLLRCVDGVGHRTILFELTTPDVAELGMSVMRAVIPGFHPLSTGFSTRPTGGRRLYEVPQRLGYPGIERGGPDNPFPHPYP